MFKRTHTMHEHCVLARHQCMLQHPFRIETIEDEDEKPLNSTIVRTYYVRVYVYLFVQHFGIHNMGMCVCLKHQSYKAEALTKSFHYYLLVDNGFFSLYTTSLNCYLVTQLYVYTHTHSLVVPRCNLDIHKTIEVQALLQRMP